MQKRTFNEIWLELNEMDIDFMITYGFYDVNLVFMISVRVLQYLMRFFDVCRFTMISNMF